MTYPGSGLTQTPITTQPTQILPGLGISSSVVLYNQDIANLVYVSYQQWFTPGSGNSIPIQPLTSITLSAAKSLYAASLVPGVAALLVAPEGTQINPSPSQVAQQIALIGTSSTLPVLLNTSGPFAVGASIGNYNVSFNSGAAYEIVVSPQVAGNTCVVDINVVHLDIGNNSVYLERFTVPTAGGLGNLGAVIRGNLHGVALQISGVVATQAFINSVYASNPTATGCILRTYARPFVSDAVPKMTPFAQDGNLLEVEAMAVGASATVTLGVLQPYSGRVFSNFSSNSGGGFNLLPLIRCFSVVGGLLYIIRFPQVGGASVGNVFEHSLSMRIHLAQVINLAAVAGTANANIVCEDYI